MSSLTFLQPALLPALFAAALPLLIHLLNRQRFQRIEFSNLMFLKVLKKDTMRRLKVRQILLLILRTLIVFFIVLAFTRPALQGRLSRGLGANVRTAAALLLDVSYSMGLRTERGTVMDLAKERASAVLDVLRTGDEVFLIPFGDRPRVPERPTSDFEAVRKGLEEMEVSSEGTNVEAALQAALRVLAGSSKPNREIYLITDRARNGWAFEEPIGPEGAGIGFFLVSLGEWEWGNVGIERVGMKEEIFAVSKPVTVEWSGRNFSDRAVEDAFAQLYAAGHRVNQSLFDVDPDGVGTFSFHVVPEKPGALSGYVEIEGDRLTTDDRRYFSVDIPGTIEVLLVGQTPGDTFYIHRALDPSGEGAGWMRVTDRTVDSVTGWSPGTYDVVVLSNVSRVSPTTLSALKAHVAAGKGVLILLGADVDVRFYDRELLPPLVPLAIKAPLGRIGDRSGFRSFGEIDFDHPIFRALVEQSRMDSPRFYVVYDTALSPAIHPIIRYSAGELAMGEGRQGTGKVIVFTSAATLVWGDFPRKGIFVPLLYRTMQYLATDRAPAQYVVGEEVLRRPSGVPGDRPLMLEDPMGGRTTLAPVPMAGGVAWRVQNVNRPGIWRLLWDGREVDRFAVNVDPRESDVRRVDEGRIRRVFGAHTYRVIGTGASLEEAISTSRYGRELWKACLAAALALMIAEMVIGRARAKEVVE